MRATLVVLLLLSLSAPAEAARRAWRMTGTLGGDYALSYSRPTSPACPADTVSESATNVELTLRSRLVYDTETRDVASVRPVVLRFAGGSATFSGRVSPPNLETCGTRTWSCTGRVAGEDGRRRFRARLNLYAGTSGGIEDSTLIAAYGSGSGPEGTPCESIASTGARGDFGPQANAVLAGGVRIPRARLAGRRRFTVKARRDLLDDPCDEDYIENCRERSTLRLKLAFTRRR